MNKLHWTLLVRMWEPVINRICFGIKEVPGRAMVIEVLQGWELIYRD